MEKVENGIFVSVDYKGTLEDGQVFDTSQGRQPLEIQMGAGQMIKGFETELMGMSLNEKKVFTLAPEHAYGQKDDTLKHSVPRSEVPPDMNLEVGMTVGLTNKEGRQMPARIIHMDDDKLTMDLNHPLAGKSLTFEIEVVGISSNPIQKPTTCGSECDCSSGCEE